jgi:hypothetical protein
MPKGTNGPPLAARFYHRAFIASVFAYAAILVYLRHYRGIPPVDEAFRENYFLIFTVLGMVNLAFGYLAPRIMTRYFRLSLPPGQEERLASLIDISRAGSFEALAVYGFVLGLMGAAWIVVLSFFAVAVTALVHTFPGNAKGDLPRR